MIRMIAADHLRCSAVSPFEQRYPLETPSGSGFPQGSKQAASAGIRSKAPRSRGPSMATTPNGNDPQWQGRPMVGVALRIERTDAAICCRQRPLGCRGG